MVVGVCIDDTDFKTIEESIAYNAAGMDVSLIVEKTDGTTAVTAITLTTGGTSDWTHKDGGYYEIEVTAAQNAEEGIAYLRGVCTGVLPFESPRYDIVKANIYDSLIKGTDVLHADVTQWLGSAAEPVVGADVTHIHGVAITETVDGYLAAAFTKLFDVATPLLVASEAMRGTNSAALNADKADWATATGFATSTALSAHDDKLDIVDGIADRILSTTEIKQATVASAGATTTKFISNLTEPENDYWNRMAVIFTSGNDTGQMRRIKAYNGATKEITLHTPLDTAPANGDTFVLPVVRAFLTPDIEDLADAVLDENVDGTHTLREILRLLGAYAFGKSSGGGTATVTFRDIDDTKDRIVATVTALGNRTDVVLTET